LQVNNNNNNNNFCFRFCCGGECMAESKAGVGVGKGAK
jgi:hypothetical protein